MEMLLYPLYTLKMCISPSHFNSSHPLPFQARRKLSLWCAKSHFTLHACVRLIPLLVGAEIPSSDPGSLPNLLFGSSFFFLNILSL